MIIISISNIQRLFIARSISQLLIVIIIVVSKMSLYLEITDLRHKEKIVILSDSKITHAFKEYIRPQSNCLQQESIHLYWECFR